MTISPQHMEAMLDRIQALPADRRVDLAADLLRVGELPLTATLLQQVLEEITARRLHTQVPDPPANHVAQVLDRYGVKPARSHAETVQILKQVSRYRVSTSTEVELHADLQRIFETLLPCEDIRHEFSCDKVYRIDFYLPRLLMGIEVKIAGSADEVARQLEGYARSNQISCLVLITSHLRHVSQLFQTGRVLQITGPRTGDDRPFLTDASRPGSFEVGGKPLTIIPIGGQLL